MPSRRHLLRTAAGGLAACLLLHINAMAQTPTVTVNDYLREVRIFAPGSPEFSEIASKLGVDAILPTLGPAASLVAAIRNDSGQAIDSMRILFQRQTGGGDVQLGQSLAAGDSTLIAPSEVSGRLAQLMIKPGVRGIAAGRGSNNAPSPAIYQGATVSVDSATLADGKFIGADTLNFFSRLVDEDSRKKAFFSDLSRLQGLSQSEIVQFLQARQAAAKTDNQKATGISTHNQGATTEALLCQLALIELKFSTTSLFEWAAKEGRVAQAKPVPHK